MINRDMKIYEHKKEYSIFYAENVFEDDYFQQMKIEAEPYEYNDIRGKRTDSAKRVWLHQVKTPYLYSIANTFDLLETKQFFSGILGFDFTNERTRVELCKDRKGSWLENHTDDVAKDFTMQIYLSSNDIGTVHNNSFVPAKENCGWFFRNTGTEYHSLSPLPVNRTSVIINYVNDKWNDKTVLV